MDAINVTSTYSYNYSPQVSQFWSSSGVCTIIKSLKQLSYKELHSGHSTVHGGQNLLYLTFIILSKSHKLAGRVAKLFLDKVDYKSSVCCVDENKDMLKISKKKLGKTNNVKWYCNNAENLPFKNNEFDYYTISFGIRNIDNVNNALGEAFRVLKPGGRLLCLEFSKVKNEILNQFYKIYSKTIPKIGKFIVGKSEPYEYLINSIEEFYSQKELLELIKKNNFTNLSFRNLSGGIVAIHSAWKI